MTTFDIDIDSAYHISSDYTLLYSSKKCCVYILDVVKSEIKAEIRIPQSKQMLQDRSQMDKIYIVKG